MFTLPHKLNALAQGNPRILYGLLFESVSATLIEFGANPRWLGGEIAATLILHTWGQTLTQHLHLHCLVAAGALHADGHWVQSRREFLFPVKALSQVFRGKFLAALTHAFDTGALNLAGATATLAQVRPRQWFFRALRNPEWVVYAKKPFGGPRRVLKYLGSLHPSRCHLQPPDSRSPKWHGRQLSVEGLRPRRPDQNHDLGRG